MRIVVLVFLQLIAAAASLSACAQSGQPDRPAAEDCARLRDHVVELRLAAADTGGRLNAADLDQHRAALSAAAGGNYLDECSSQRTTGEVACLLAAADLDSLRTCAPTPDPED